MRLAVGVPTFCETETISHLIKRVDGAIQREFSSDNVWIINSDNCSPDRTSETFLKTPTVSPKIALSSSPGFKGKGYNFRRIFEHSRDLSVDCLVCLDADLEYLPDDWLPVFVKAVEGGADMVAPLYSRHWYDGNLTNQIVAPLVATTGRYIRQPIGGDFAFSRTAIERFLALDWPERVMGYGVDVFLTLRSIVSGLQLVQAPLSVGKVHSWRSNTASEVRDEMAGKFDQVVGTLLNELSDFPLDHQRQGRDFSFPEAPSIAAPAKEYTWRHLIDAAEQAWKQSARLVAERQLFVASPRRAPTIDDEAWADILASILKTARQRAIVRDDIIGFETLFYCRLATVMPSLKQISIEGSVRKLASLVEGKVSPANSARS